jgi:hypothetical protein
VAAALDGAIGELAALAGVGPKPRRTRAAAARPRAKQRA